MAWFRRLREAPVTSLFIVANLCFYLIMAAWSGHLLWFDADTLVDAGALLWDPRVGVSRWRWLTAAFIHTGLPHIAMNLWVLGQIGILSEAALGRGLVAGAYVFTGVLGNAVSYTLASSRHREMISAGASGAIMGLIGMAATFAWLTGQKRAARTLAFNILLVLGVGLSLSARGVSLVDNGAHIGGLVGGVALGLARVRMTRPPPRWLDVTLVVASLALAAVAFLVVQLRSG
jgi:membrane associated rhomboid family serine protease